VIDLIKMQPKVKYSMKNC